MCLFNDPQSRTLFLLMQVTLLLFFLLQVPMRLYPHFHPDLMDGIRGLFLGMALGLMIVASWKNRRRVA